MGADLVAAFGLLTRLPLPRGVVGSSTGRSIWAWPVVGLVVGAIAAVVYALAWRLHLSPWLGGVLAVIAMVVTTGGFHEDGLADTADGVGGGATPEARLLIMKDSRIGSFGALALVGSVALRAGAVAQIAEPRLVAPALIVAAVFGRAAMPGVLMLSSAARPGGLAAGLGAPARPRIYVGWAMAGLVGLVLLRPHEALVAVFTTILVTAGMAALGQRYLGGYTGDTLGATEQIGECAVLVVVAAAAPFYLGHAPA
jgi:adenosylcobinamide-GDP ribazoletransferase